MATPRDNEPSITRAEAASGRQSSAAARRWRSSVWTTEVGGRRFVVKDYLSTCWLYRWTLARLELAREQRAYEALEGCTFVARCYGRLDRHALLFEHVDARTMTEAGPDVRPATLERLHAAVAAMHARGVLHNDLRHRSNILVTAAGDVRLIDFASAVLVRRGWRRWCFGWLAFLDRSAAIKWWLRYDPDGVPASELSWYRRYLRWRRLWPARNPALQQQRMLAAREHPVPPLQPKTASSARKRRSLSA
jgi:predicted Ser/Thr protein kinase